MVQSMPDASPAKWHLAHTTWFFETFILAEQLPGYRIFNPDYRLLFNSYYKTLGSHPAASPARNFFAPILRQCSAYRDPRGRGDASPARHRAIRRNSGPRRTRHSPRAAAPGTHPHRHPACFLDPAVAPRLRALPLPSRHRAHSGRGAACAGSLIPAAWWRSAHPARALPSTTSGPVMPCCSRPTAWHPDLLTNAEYLDFIHDKGYQRPELWLSDGWDTVCREVGRRLSTGRRPATGWCEFTLRGMRSSQSRSPRQPVSYYEADAFARWSGARLPLESEWEQAAKDRTIAGNLLESWTLEPRPSQRPQSNARAEERSVVRRFMGVDRQRLSRLSRLPSRARRGRRVQRKIHVQSVRPARRIVRHLCLAPSRNLPQLLSAPCALAVHGYQAGKS